MASRGSATLRTFTQRVPRYTHLAPTSLLVPSSHGNPQAAYMSARSFFSHTANPGMLRTATRGLKGKKKIATKNILRKVSEPVEILQKDIEVANGIHIFSLFKRWQFWREIRDPQKTMELTGYIVSARGKLGGMWHDFEKELRKSLKFNIDKGNERDHRINIADVALKIIIQSLRYTLPNIDELKVIIDEVNKREYIREIPKATHKVVSDVEAHIVVEETFKVGEGNEVLIPSSRVVSMTELYEALSKENKKLLDDLSTEERTNFLDEQRHYCNKFVNELEKRKTEFLTRFADNFKDFYLNHRIAKPVQSGGAAEFTDTEERLFLLLVELLGTNVDLEENATREKNENIDKSAKAAHKTLKEIKIVVNDLFKNVRNVYQSQNSTQSTIRMNDTNLSYPTHKLRGGKTYKKRR